MAEPKSAWPELVGKTQEEAEAAVKADRPDVKIQHLGEADPATMDFREDRVRIVHGGDGNVVQPPCTG